MEHHCDLEEFNERAFFFERCTAWRGCWFNVAASMDIPPQDLFPAHWAPKCKSPDCLVCMQMYVKCLHCRCIGGGWGKCLCSVNARTHKHKHTLSPSPLLFFLDCRINQKKKKRQDLAEKMITPSKMCSHLSPVLSPVELFSSSQLGFCEYESVWKRVGARDGGRVS